MEPNPTDVSSFKDAYKTAVQADFSPTLEIRMGDQVFTYHTPGIVVRYGTNPHQPFGFYAPDREQPLVVGNMELLKGGKGGLSLTNLQDISHAAGAILKYFSRPACAIMKHVNPCGFKVQTNGESGADMYRKARGCDERSAFGGVIVFNYEVDTETAEAVMETFIEGIVAPGYSEGALEVLRRNEDTKKLNNAIRVGKINDPRKLPTFVGDDVTGYMKIGTFEDGSISVEVPYLTRIRSADDLILMPMIPNSNPEKNGGKDYTGNLVPTAEQLDDLLTSWYVNISVRSNGVVIVKDGKTLSVGTGQQERIGAVEQAIAKAHQKKQDLEGAVLSSDGFFPSRDCIDAAADAGIKAITWPAGSMNDAIVIEAANQRGIALAATLERCFSHH
jgi:phosphoribosylaminoimidazolecarboxamide formyltransferase/IMP cyclohydrolase